MKRIPTSYVTARLRNSTPVDQGAQEIGVGLYVDGGREGFITESHSRSSAGIPSVDVSCTSMMENVLPPAKSPAAISGVA